MMVLIKFIKTLYVPNSSTLKKYSNQNFSEYLWIYIITFCDEML